MTGKSGFTIHLGNKVYSSWSLRGWLALKLTGAPFEEVVYPMAGPGSVTVEIRDRSPSGRVPLLKHGEILVWDSLAIAEYLAETFPDAKLWPTEARARATARSVSAEMHSGFTAVRSAMAMNVRRAPFALAYGDDVRSEVARIEAIWRECRAAHGKSGPFLFGAFTIADAMFAPVATRFHTYGARIESDSRAYVDAVRAFPVMREWISAAEREPWRIEAYERIGT